MALDRPLRILAAAGLVLLAVIVGLIAGASVTASLFFFLCGIAAVLLLATAPEPESPAAEAPQAARYDAADVLDAIGDPLLIIGESRVLIANGAARALLGQHIVGEDVRVAVRHPAAAEQLASDAGAEQPVSIDLLGLGGREQRWQMRVSPLAPGRRLVHMIDRSGSHAAERMRVDFVANASHELRTPLAAILGFIETLGDRKAGDDPATRDRFLRIMFDEAQRMQHLVEDLMSLSRIEADKYRAPDSAVDVAALAAESHRAVRDGGSERGGDVVTDLEDGLPPVAGDPAQLSQLIDNLLGNAMKYGRAGTPVTLKVAHGARSMIELSVADQGDGIPPEHLPRVTERFYRVDSGRSRAMGGTGLGLAIVKHIVERHRGRLDIRSTPGEGTTVTVLLPVAGEPLSSKSHASVTEGA